MNSIAAVSVPASPTADVREQVLAAFARRYKLSGRQAQLVAGAIQGLSSKEIAAALGIDYRTVAQHLARVCDKVGVSDRHQVISRVIDLLLESMEDQNSFLAHSPRERDG